MRGKRIQSYDFDIKYVKGNKNVVVDALSRMQTTFSLMDINNDWRELLLVDYSKNKFVCELLNVIKQDDRYRFTNDISYYKVRIFVVLDSQVKEMIMRAMHDSPLARDQGFFKIYMQV